MSQILLHIIEGIALRIEEKPAVALFIDNLQKMDEILLSTVVDTVIGRFGMPVEKLKLMGGGVVASIEGGEYEIYVKSVPVKSGKGHIAARTIQGMLKKHSGENVFVISLVYPLPYGESADEEDAIVDALKKKGVVYRRPVFVQGRRGVVYAVVPSKEDKEVITVKETDVLGTQHVEKTSTDDNAKIPPEGMPGLLYFRKKDASADEIMDALQHEGALLSDLIKKRTEAVKVLGERGLSVVSNSDIATHRLYIADLSGGFGDFIAEVVRLRQEGMWDDSVKEVVKAFLKEYERLGVSGDTIKDALHKHGIDITV